MSPETRIQLSDRLLKKLLTPSIVQTFKNNHFLFPDIDPNPGNDESVFYNAQEIGKAFHALYLYKIQQELGCDSLNFPGLHGIIPRKVFTEIINQPWYKEIREKWKKEVISDKKYLGPKVTLTAVLRKSLVDTISSGGWRHRRTRRVKIL